MEGGDGGSGVPIMTNFNSRESEFPIDPMFLDRWSPRAFTGEPISEGDLLTMLDAAHWAPSSFNSQPWRFLYARRDTPNWTKFLHLLVAYNQIWAQNAAALVFIVSNSQMRLPGGVADVPSQSHSLDAGTASGFFALQARKMGWYVHGMAGFNRDRAVIELIVPPGYRVEAVYAVGKKADKSSLPEKLQAKEQPNTRRPLREVVFEGGFPPAG
jgi:nitroreductase